MIGAPHPDLGETVIALIVADEEGLDTAAIEAAIEGRPRLIEVVADLPRNAMGKIQKGELRSRYTNRFL